MIKIAYFMMGSSMNSNYPSGTVTFLFTDIEGSTRLWQELPEGMSVSNARHDAILRAAINANNGFIFETIGDSFHVAFHTALDALCAALSAQRALQAEPWGETGAIRVRMGLYTGAAEFSSDGSNKYDYHASYATIAATARVMSVAHGGQVLISHTTHDLLQNNLPGNVTLRDMGEHRLKDLRSPLHLFQLIAPDLPQEFPAITSLNALPNNLPVQLTRFIGREKELAEVEQLLAGTRLLTLTGSGGTGKTRLSLQAAAGELEHFPHGVWLVELASVVDPQIVVQIVANVLAVRETSGRTLQDALVDYLRYKTLLLVLDNCEHLIEACAQLAYNLLHACPDLKILASSREALGIAGEATFQVPSLSLPPALKTPGSIPLPDLQQSEAVCLFEERARAVSPAFCLEVDNAPAVVHICRRLDGIPLAIELAAARVKMLTPIQIAARLDDSFRLLTGGSRTALPRQQTLKALIDWSWELLSDSEKKLLRRLSVFAGSFNLEAVESVCADYDPVPAGALPLSQYEILDLLEGLVNKSLVQAEEQGSEARYRLLLTIREYANDQLQLSGDAAGVRNRHLVFFASLAEEAEPQLMKAEMLDWIDRLEREADNLRAAMEWGLASCHPAALSLAKGLIHYWSQCGLDSEGWHWLERALACLPPPPLESSGTAASQAALQRQATRAYLLAGSSVCVINLGNIELAFQNGEEAVQLARTCGDQLALCNALVFKALAMSFLKEYLQQAETAAQESIALARRLGNIWLQCIALSVLTGIGAGKGDLPAAFGYQQEHARLARRLGNPWAIAMSIYGLLVVGREGENLADIRRQMEEGIQLFTRLKNYVFIAALRSQFAHILRRLGEIDEAQAIYLKTLPLWLELGNHAAVAHQLECLAALAGARRQSERAARLLGAAHDLRARLHSEMAPDERPDYEATLAGIRLSLDQAALDAAWSSGEVMSMEQAVAYALKINHE
jgi:predicted ATPase/class 3 adenylate cyclase